MGKLKENTLEDLFGPYMDALKEREDLWKALEKLKNLENNVEIHKKRKGF